MLFKVKYHTKMVTVHPVSGIVSTWYGWPFGPWRITVSASRFVTGKSGSSFIGVAFFQIFPSQLRVLRQRDCFGFKPGMGNNILGGFQRLKFSSIITSIFGLKCFKKRAYWIFLHRSNNLWAMDAVSRIGIFVNWKYHFSFKLVYKLPFQFVN